MTSLVDPDEILQEFGLATYRRHLEIACRTSRYKNQATDFGYRYLGRTGQLGISFRYLADSFF